MVTKAEIVSKRVIILNALRQSGEDYASGQSLAQLLGISRAAVAKHMASFETAGFNIATRPGCGYRLIDEPDDLIIPEAIASHLPESTLPDFQYFNDIDSTNDAALRAEASTDLLVIAKTQSAGRGRRGATWRSPSGGIWMSVKVETNISARIAGWIPMAIAVEVSQVIKSATGLESMLKWPNDIYVVNKKTAGILVQTMTEADDIVNVIAGIGINANFKAGRLGRLPVTTLMDAAGHKIDRAAMIAKIYLGTKRVLDELSRNRLSYYRQEWDRKDLLRSRQLTVERDGHTFVGKASGIDADARLILETKDGPVTLGSGSIIAVES